MTAQTTDHFPTVQDALEYRAAWNARMRELYRKTMPTLRDLETQRLAAMGQTRLLGGPQSKEEYVSALLELDYPTAALNESTHVAYHHAEQRWPDCPHCQAAAAAEDCDICQTTGGCRCNEGNR